MAREMADRVRVILKCVKGGDCDDGVVEDGVVVAVVVAVVVVNGLATWNRGRKYAEMGIRA